MFEYFISESNAVEDKNLVCHLQDIHSQALEMYCNLKHQTSCSRFGRLIMKTINLREINLLKPNIPLEIKLGGNKGRLPEALQQFYKYDVTS